MEPFFHHVSVLNSMADSTSEDYNMRSQERTELLKIIKRCLNGQDVYPAFWACCQVADLSHLKQLLDLAKLFPRTLIQINDNSTWITRQCEPRRKYLAVSILIPYYKGTKQLEALQRVRK